MSVDQIGSSIGVYGESMGSYGPWVMDQIEMGQQQFVTLQARSKIQEAVTEVFRTGSKHIQSWGQSYMIQAQAQGRAEGRAPQAAPQPTMDLGEGAEEGMAGASAGGMGTQSVIQEVDELISQSADFENEADEIF